MTYFRDSTDPAYREYCAKIVSLQKRFSQEDRERIVREFLSEGLNAKEVSMAQLYSDELLKGKPLEQEQGPSISETMAKLNMILHICFRKNQIFDFRRMNE